MSYVWCSCSPAAFGPMSHAKALRVIGQTLDTAGITTFKLNKCAEFYGLWTADYVFCFAADDICRLDSNAQKRRKNNSMPIRSTLLSHQLRALGDYLDRREVTTFRIVWTADSALLDYEQLDGDRTSKAFTPEELRQLGLHRSLFRSSQYLLHP